MLNIGKLRRGGENYYLNSVARGVEDYYLGSGEAPGYWMASGAADQGLAGEVGDEALRMVLKGAAPGSGRQLVEPRRGERVPGFDLTFLAPKSVALLHELGPKDAFNEVVSAHDAAVAAALAYLERHASGARRGKGGALSIASKGFIGAAFRHRTSRAGDPLLHTHVLVANLIQGRDGRWGALDAKHLYRHAKTAGYLYQAHLRFELTRRLGVEWTPVRKGAADIEGFPREAIEAFSKRRLEVKSVLGERSHASHREREVAALRTRYAKDYSVSPQRLLPAWRAKAQEVGLSEQALEKSLARTTVRDLDATHVREIERELLAPTGLTASESSFSRREVMQGFCSRLASGASVTVVEALADRFLASDEIVTLSPLTRPLSVESERRVAESVASSTQEPRYTTKEMLSVERDVIELAIDRRFDKVAITNSAALTSALRRSPGLFPDQRAMVENLTTSGVGVEVVVGKAGAGKTTALNAAREAWQASGYEVVGCTLAARAARELEAGSGIRSFTIAGLLQDLDGPRSDGLPSNSVLVVDEAGMVGTRDLKRLLEHAEHAAAKVVLVGDDRQLPEIEAGGAFRGIKNRLPANELTEVRRQPFGWERDALGLIREGRSRQAVDAYLEHDRVVMTSSSEETRRRLIEDWWATQHEREPAVMIAAHRSDVADLNARARRMMAAAGRLGEVELEYVGGTFAVGDRVMTLRNSARLGVSNGDRGTVEAVDPGTGEVVFRRDDGTLITLPASYLQAGHVTHAYALTGHKTQAMTTNKAFVLGDETLYREWAYVAMSRGRNDNRLYLVAGSDVEREEAGGEIEAPEDPLDQLVQALGRSRAKDLALELSQQGELRRLTPAELRRERDALTESLRVIPPDVTHELTDVRAERERVEKALQHQARIAQAGRTTLVKMGFARRRLRSAEVARVRQQISTARNVQAQLRAKLKRLASKEIELERARRLRERWLVEHAPMIARRAGIERELNRRKGRDPRTSEVITSHYHARHVAAPSEQQPRPAAGREADRTRAQRPASAADVIERSLEL